MIEYLPQSHSYNASYKVCTTNNAQNNGNMWGMYQSSYQFVPNDGSFDSKLEKKKKQKRVARFISEPPKPPLATNYPTIKNVQNKHRAAYRSSSPPVIREEAELVAPCFEQKRNEIPRSFDIISRGALPNIMMVHGSVVLMKPTLIK